MEVMVSVEAETESDPPINAASYHSVKRAQVSPGSHHADRCARRGSDWQWRGQRLGTVEESGAQSDGATKVAGCAAFICRRRVATAPRCSSNSELAAVAAALDNIVGPTPASATRSSHGHCDGRWNDVWRAAGLEGRENEYLVSHPGRV